MTSLSHAWSCTPHLLTRLRSRPCQARQPGRHFRLGRRIVILDGRSRFGCLGVAVSSDCNWCRRDFAIEQLRRSSFDLICPFWTLYGFVVRSDLRLSLRCRPGSTRQDTLRYICRPYITACQPSRDHRYGRKEYDVFQCVVSSHASLYIPTLEMSERLTRDNT